tara:strand:+ start:965 stop:2830 length:1866 start_codon:yes stop_codon:yes gene_type:complete
MSDLATFISLTGATKSRAQTTLSAHKGDLPLALDAFFSHVEECGDDASAAAPSSVRSAATLSQQRGQRRGSRQQQQQQQSRVETAQLLRFQSVDTQRRQLGSARNHNPASFRRPTARSKAQTTARRSASRRLDRVNSRFFMLLDPRRAAALSEAVRRALVDVDARPDWETVVAVSELPGGRVVEQCPICLDAPLHAPRCSPCGHVFCSPCVLRYLGTGPTRRVGGELPCPVCKVQLRAADLRPFVAAQSASSEGGGGDGGRRAAATLILMCRSDATGVVGPLRSSSSSERDAREDGAVPQHGSVSARFSRMSWASPAALLTALTHDRSELDARSVELASLREQDAWAPSLKASVAAVGALEAVWTGVSGDAGAVSGGAGSSGGGGGDGDGALASPLKGSGSCYLFYQTVSGRRAVLSPFSLRCIREEFGAGVDAASIARYPRELRAPILDSTDRVLTQEYRRSKPALRHLPLQSHITELELDLTHVLSAKTRKRLKSEIRKQRKIAHKRRAGRTTPSSSSASPLRAARVPAEEEARILSQHLGRRERAEEAAAALRAEQVVERRRKEARDLERLRDAFPELGATEATTNAARQSSEETPASWASRVQQKESPWSTRPGRRR